VRNFAWSRISAYSQLKRWGKLLAIHLWSDRLPLQTIHSFLVHPGKHSEEVPPINGTAVPLNGRLFDLLRDIYVDSEDECDIDIAFSPEDGRQQNPCRDLILAYIGNPTLARGRRIAERLQLVTDGRSGIGLLFLIGGREGRDHKIVVSRFPTDTAILADEDRDSLTVQFLERVFMKSKTSYKAVVYRDASLQAGFWTGQAIDKQITGQLGESSNYWIFDFLTSDFSVTPAAGTRRLGGAIREAAKRTTDINVKRELVAAATLATNLGGQRTSIADFERRFHLSRPARDALRNELRSPHVANEQFRFDLEEFNDIVRYRSVELDNGGMMTALSSDFDDVFEQRVVNRERNEIRFSTQGRVVNERLKKTS
jgi:hypothetical protein